MAKRTIDQQLQYGTIIKTTPFSSVQLPHHRKIDQKVNAEDIQQRFHHIEEMLGALHKLSEEIRSTQASLAQKQNQQSFDIREIGDRLSQQEGNVSEKYQELCSILEVLNQDIQSLKQNMNSMQGSLEQMESQWDQWEAFIKNQENSLQQQLLQEVEESSRFNAETSTPDIFDIKNAEYLGVKPQPLQKYEKAHMELNDRELACLESSSAVEEESFKSQTIENAGQNFIENDAEAASQLQLEAEIQRQLKNLEQKQPSFPDQLAPNSRNKSTSQSLQTKAKPNINAFDGWFNSSIGINEESILGLDISQRIDTEENCLDLGRSALEEGQTEQPAKYALAEPDELETPESESADNNKTVETSSGIAIDSSFSAIASQPAGYAKTFEDATHHVSENYQNEESLNMPQSNKMEPVAAELVKLDHDPDEIESHIQQLMDNIEMSMSAQTIEFISDDILSDWQTNIVANDTAKNTEHDDSFRSFDIDILASQLIHNNSASSVVNMEESATGSNAANTERKNTQKADPPATLSSKITATQREPKDSKASTSPHIEFQEYPESIGSQLFDFDIELYEEDDHLIQSAVHSELRPADSKDQTIAFSQLADMNNQQGEQLDQNDREQCGNPSEAQASEDAVQHENLPQLDIHSSIEAENEGAKPQSIEDKLDLDECGQNDRERIPYAEPMNRPQIAETLGVPVQDSLDELQNDSSAEIDHILAQIAEDNRQAQQCDEESAMMAEIINALAEIDPRPPQEKSESNESLSDLQLPVSPDNRQEIEARENSLEEQAPVKSALNPVNAAEEGQKLGKGEKTSTLLDNKQNLTDQALEMIKKLPVASSLENLDDQLSSEISQLITELGPKDELQLVTSQHQESQFKKEKSLPESKASYSQSRLELPDNPFEIPGFDTSMYLANVEKAPELFTDYQNLSVSATDPAIRQQLRSLGRFQAEQGVTRSHPSPSSAKSWKHSSYAQYSSEIIQIPDDPLAIESSTVQTGQSANETQGFQPNHAATHQQRQSYNTISSQQILMDENLASVFHDEQTDGASSGQAKKLESENPQVDSLEKILQVQDIAPDEGIPVLNINLSTLTNSGQNHWKDFLLNDNEEFEILLNEEN